VKIGPPFVSLLSINPTGPPDYLSAASRWTDNARACVISVTVALVQRIRIVSASRPHLARYTARDYDEIKTARTLQRGQSSSIAVCRTDARSHEPGVLPKYLPTAQLVQDNNTVSILQGASRIHSRRVLCSSLLFAVNYHPGLIAQLEIARSRSVRERLDCVSFNFTLSRDGESISHLRDRARDPSL